MKNGWGNCPDCGRDIGATRCGLAVRHGYLRVKRGYRRVNLPHLQSGHDHHACPGSGKPLLNHIDLRKRRI